MSLSPNATRAETRTARALLALAAGYVAALMVVALLRAVADVPTVTDVASSPWSVAHGQIWTLVTSAFVVSGPPVAEIAGVAAVGALLILRHGPVTFWRAALAGHIGSAVLAYAALGVLAAAGVHLTHRVLHNPDYGVSCVWAGVVGALGVSAARRLHRRRRRRALAALIVSYTALLVLSLVVGVALLRAEHTLALLLGAAVML